MSASNTPSGDAVLDFEWNVFEQALDCYNLPSQQGIPSEASTSPESISYFAPDHSNTFLPLNFTPPTSTRPPRASKKSASSRARRQTQNREAQRAFRIRQRQRFEDLENELHLLRSRYESLQEKYANLHLLYMQRVGFDGNAGPVGSASIARTSGAAGASGTAETNVGAPQQLMKGGNESNQHLDLQQADVAAWLSATGQLN